MGLLLVAYDVSQDRRRDRVAAALGRWGRRVQYSVFLLHRGSLEEVGRVLGGLVDGGEDRVRIQPLCAACEAKALLLGGEEEGVEPAGYRVI